MVTEIRSPETCRVVADILERFGQWANERISDYEDMPHPTREDVAKVDKLITAQRNLYRIVSEVTGIKG